MNRRLSFSFLLFFAAGFANAQSTLKVSGLAWQGLSLDERESIQRRYVVETLAPESFGTIIDNQAADRSSPGTTAGANLGQAVANAAYIDRAIGSGDYSAKSHLGAMLLGGLLGSALDRPGQSQYQFRYAIRLGSGNVIYQDAFSVDPFRHSVGVCVSVPALTLLPEQHICNQTTDSLRNAHLTAYKELPLPANTQAQTPKDVSPSAKSNEDIVTCKVGTLAPVQTTIDKCKIINGVIVP